MLALGINLGPRLSKQARSLVLKIDFSSMNIFRNNFALIGRLHGFYQENFVAQALLFISITGSSELGVVAC